MVKLFGTLTSFEQWFVNKLIEEKSRRINHIKNIWDNLTPKQRENLIIFVNNDFLLRFIKLICEKKYNELFTITKFHIKNSFELIEKWEKNNKLFFNS